MSKAPAKTTASGNYQTASTCTGPHPHTVYKKDGDTANTYKCPYDKCGHDVV